jgi:hypothetical protein
MVSQKGSRLVRVLHNYQLVFLPGTIAKPRHPPTIPDLYIQDLVTGGTLVAIINHRTQ